MIDPCLWVLNLCLVKKLLEMIIEEMPCWEGVCCGEFQKKFDALIVVQSN